MPLPFKVNPEPPKRSADADPFMEFASERPSVRVSGSSHEPLLRPERSDLLGDRLDITRSDPTLGLGQPRRSSALSPAFAFGIGVAGLVAAAMAYYQLSQVLSTRTSQSQTAAASGTPAPTSPAAAAPAAPAPTATAVDPITSAPLPPGTGRVDVASYPPGALVTLNGTVRGVTPYILTALPAGRHTIVISRGASSVTRTIELSPGEATAVSVTLRGSAGPSTQREPAGPLAGFSGTPASPGWVAFETPIELQVFQDGRLRGTTTAGNITLPAGTHNVVLSNPALEYREVVSITVTAGRTTQSRVTLPSGSLSVNALPWAEVFVDGNAVGTTPLANLSLPIGTHEVLWRHPTLGDRRQVVVIKAKTPARAGVDFTR